MRVAFYKGWNKTGTIYDKAICVYTLSKYSHCELIFSNGMSFSSSPRDGGCRYKHIQYNSDQWDIVYISSSEVTEQYIMKFCDEQIGKKYDWWGIFFSQVIPLGYQNPHEWFCSEILSDIFGADVPAAYSPKDLYKYLKKINYSFIKESLIL